MTWCDNMGKTNYGQILQCYAIQTICTKMGFEPIVIRYRKKLDNDLYKGKYPIAILNRMYELIYKIIVVEERYDKRIYRFQKFIKEWINLSKPCYDNSDIDAVVEGCDSYLCGSDQIWNPIVIDPIFFLQFGRSKIPRVAYAPSGILFEDQNSEQAYKTMLPWIQQIDSISVREEKSVEILNKYVDKDILCVLDPTMLLEQEEWDGIAAGRLIKEPYILCYFIGDIKQYRLILQALKEKYQVNKIVYIPSNLTIHKSKFAEAYDSAGPAEFVSLIKYADAVCADSYHGILFSIKYQKQFYTFERKQKDFEKWSSTERIGTVLSKLHLGQRTLRCTKDVGSIVDIDYCNVDIYLQQEVENSKKFLQMALIGK